MRLRNIPGCEEYLESQTDFFVLTDSSLKEQECRGKWKNIFDNGNPIHAEFGSGMGKFILEMAIVNPNINYIAVEFKAEALYRAVKRAEKYSKENGKDSLKNLKYLLYNVDKMEEVFGEGELDRIYLNFVDPWHKARHAKRRLTHRRFLGRFNSLMGEGGELHFKTDNRPLFEFSLNEFADENLKMRNISLDLVKSKFEGNVTTEYEEKFMKKGNPIYRVEVVLDQGVNEI